MAMYIILQYLLRLLVGLGSQEGLVTDSLRALRPALGAAPRPRAAAGEWRAAQPPVRPARPPGVPGAHVAGVAGVAHRHAHAHARCSAEGESKRTYFI